MSAAVAGVDASATLKCSKPINNLPFYRVEKAVLRHLQAWMTEGKLPPSAPPLTTAVNGSFVRDGVGNALGGVRLPEVAAPLNAYGISNGSKVFAGGNLLSAFGCAFAGSSTPLTPAQLAKLYTSQADFLTRYQAASEAAVAAGYLLPEDAAKGLAEAQARAGSLALP
jgi:HEAT repeat protein